MAIEKLFKNKSASSKELYTFSETRFNKIINILKNTLVWSYYFICLMCPILALISTALKAIFFSETFSIVSLFKDPVVISTIRTTFSLAFTSAVINLFCGFLVAWVLSRYNFLFKGIFESLIDLPFSIPSSVSGLSIISLYNSNGFLGKHLHKYGIQLEYTRPLLIIALLFVCLPFTVRTLEPVIKEMDKNVEEMSHSLGGSDLSTFIRIVLPSVFPALLTSFTLTFSRAIGEYGCLVIVSSNMAFKDLVASVLIFQSLEQYEFEKATNIAIILLICSYLMTTFLNVFQNWNKQRQN